MVAAAVAMVTAADWVEGSRRLSWSGRGGGNVVAAAVDLVLAADEAESGRCSLWLGWGGGKSSAAGGS